MPWFYFLWNTQKQDIVGQLEHVVVKGFEEYPYSGDKVIENTYLFSKMSWCPHMTNVAEARQEGDVLLTSNDDVTLWGKLAL